MSLKTIYCLIWVIESLVMLSSSQDIGVDNDYDHVEIKCRGLCILGLDGGQIVNTSEIEEPFYLITKAYHKTKLFSLEVRGESGSGAFKITSTPKGIFSSHPENWLCTDEEVSESWREVQDSNVTWKTPLECSIAVEDEEEYDYEDYDFIREHVEGEDLEQKPQKEVKRIKRSILSKHGEIWLSLDCDKNITQYCISYGKESWVSYLNLDSIYYKNLLHLLPVVLFFLFTTFLLMFMVETLGLKRTKKKRVSRQSQKISAGRESNFKSFRSRSKSLKSTKNPFSNLFKKHNE